MHSESKPFLALLVLLLCAVVAPSLASGEGIKPSGTAAVKATAKEDCPEKGEKKLTAAIDGKNMAYTVKTGLTPILDKDAGETAYIFSASYILDGGPRERPVMFLFNGGPGSSSAFLQVCAFAPMTVPGINHGLEMAAPPYKLQANPHSLLDVADMVFIDPVGTGYSRMAKPDKEGKEGEKKEPVKMDAYLGVQGDLESMVEFVRMWLTENDRWGAEIYLAGESYGGLRAAGMAGIMGQQIGVAPSGIVLISPALSYQDTTSGLDNNVTPFVNRIPSMAAAAQYHKRLGGALKNLSRDEVVERAVRWAAERFEPALRKGNRLERGERETLLRELSEFTGIPVRELDAQDMRMEASEFSAQLLRDEKKIRQHIRRTCHGAGERMEHGRRPDVKHRRRTVQDSLHALFDGNGGHQAEAPVSVHLLRDNPDVGFHLGEQRTRGLRLDERFFGEGDATAAVYAGISGHGPI